MGGLRRVVSETLLSEAQADEAVTSRVVAFADSRVRELPTHIRLGVEAVELMLGPTAYIYAGRPFAAMDVTGRAALIAKWERSPLTPMRQYVRMMRSFVLFAAHELAGTETEP